jgi:hypothetical protein
VNSEPRPLSSAQTFVMKVLFPVIWIGGFAIATLSLFLFPNSWRGANGGPPGPAMKWLFLFATIVGTVFILWACGRLKRVRMDATTLYISNYSTEIVVPLANVAEITENYWMNGNPVTIRFHSNTEFGSEVTFMPKIRWSGFWFSHPAAEEIRLAVNRATGRG